MEAVPWVACMTVVETIDDGKTWNAAGEINKHFIGYCDHLGRALITNKEFG